MLEQLPTERNGCIQRQVTEIFDGEMKANAVDEGLGDAASCPPNVADDIENDTPLSGAVTNEGQKLKLKLVNARLRGLLRELQAPVEKPPGIGWEFGGDSWMRLVGNEFDRNRRKNSRFELSAILREHLLALRTTCSDTSASKVLTLAKNAVSESEQFLIATALILISKPEPDVIHELRSVLEAYHSQ